jgi:AcrR family transcriptional regulator
VVRRSSPQVLPSRRDRRRQETITDIKTAARAQLAEGGPTGISLRAIARQLGMTPSAVHYYFPGREALLDALIVDGWDSLAMTLRARYEQTRPLPAHERWIAVTRAHRAWALEHSSEYLLLYGHTGLRVTPGGDRSIRKAMSKVVAVLFTMMRDALAAGEIDTERLQTATPAPLRQQLADWRETTEEMAGLPDGALLACLIGYAQLHGAITLELVGRIPPQLQPTALFDLQMAHVSGSLNAPPPPWLPSRDGLTRAPLPACGVPVGGSSGGTPARRFRVHPSTTTCSVTPATAAVARPRCGDSREGGRRGVQNSPIGAAATDERLQADPSTDRGGSRVLSRTSRR